MSRKLDLSQFAGDDEDEPIWPKAKTLALTDLKSRTFSHGITKKTKKDIEREAEEKKLREEEEARAKVLADFENAFDDAASGPSGSFGGRGMGGGFVRAGGAPVGPKATIPVGPSQPPRGPSALGYARPHKSQPRPPSPPPSGSKPRGKRAMDSFLEEIKGNQAARENRFGKTAKVEGSSVSALAAWENSSAARHNEQDSTNLFVGNLPATTTEDVLGRFFAEIGPVGTVKIMYPRSEMEREAAARGRMSLTGFVAYMKRKDAETAVQELDGAEWGHAKLKVGFSKWVPIPAKALYDFTPHKKRSRSRSPERDRTRPSRTSRSPSPDARGRTRRETSRSPKRRRRSRSQSYTSDSRSPSPHRTSEKDKARQRWLDKTPENQAKLIRAVVEKVKDKGRGFEDLLMDREKDNPDFTFFFDKTLPGYHLYLSLLSSRYRIPTPPPEGFDDEGYASIYSSDSAEESERERSDKERIGRLGKKRLEAMLRIMSGKRAEIARAMEFAVKRAEAADDVAELVCQSLKIDGTPVPRKLARLHLVSDILHNSASPIPNVWKYRLAFEKRLPLVFAHMNGVYDSLRAYTGDISAEVFKGQVGAVLDIWERWIVFTSEVQDSLRDYFSGKRKPGEEGVRAEERKMEYERENRKESAEKDMSGFKTSGFKSSFKPITTASNTMRPVESDVDGEPINVDGEPLDDVDGVPMSDVDGEAMAIDVDGESMDEDLDGEAM